MAKNKLVIRTPKGERSPKKEEMLDWIMKNQKLGKALKKLGYSEWEIWRSFQTMNKDFLTTIIAAAM